jgi:hypothetical protein
MARLVRPSEEGSRIPVPFILRRECAPAAAAEGSKRIDILPGQPFVALSWNGAECGPCCYSNTPVPLVPGVYRLEPRACGGESGGWEGPTFDVSGSGCVLERFRAAANIEKASVFKVVAPGPKMSEKARSIHPRSSGDQSWSVAKRRSPELVSRVGNPTGFNNIFTRRCEGGDRYGFRLTRNVPHVGREVTELAIELRCTWISQRTSKALHERRMDARSVAPPSKPACAASPDRPPPSRRVLSRISRKCRDHRHRR